MRAALLLILLAAPAHAACQGDEAFSCQVGKKTLEICYWKGMLTYRFGPEGKPELTLNEPLETVDFMPWPGIGRAIWDSVVSENKGIAYEVWSSFDKLDENAVMEGGVNVMQGDETLATLSCDKGSVGRGLETLGELKAGIGQCFDHETQTWGLCN